RKVVDIAGTQLLGHELSQRTTTWQSTQTLSQGLIHTVPGLEFRADDGTTVLGGTLASGLTVGKCPGNYLWNRQRTANQSSHVEKRFVPWFKSSRCFSTLARKNVEGKYRCDPELRKPSFGLDPDAPLALTFLRSQTQLARLRPQRRMRHNRSLLTL